MTKAIRQENLYGAEDWTVVYTSFKNADFTAYDFDTLRQSMVDYMQVNYAEEFNDYIQSSEFIALLDLVAYVGQNLAFRMDLNARENILDTAEKRESVLRIARMLSYKPKRVRVAQGLLKVTSVQTSESILDSLGQDLSNKTISWGADPSELEYERFMTVMNSVFSSNNPFGTPAHRSVNTSTGNIFEIYKCENSTPIINYPISAVADGTNLNFDIVPVEIDTAGSIQQPSPDYNSSFNLLYRNDSKGVGSTKTGFFVLAKQGYTASRDEVLISPQSNLIIDLEQTSSISEDDFYVQTVDAAGNILKEWKRVGNLDYTNIVVNSYGNAEKDLYEVIYSSADVTSIKFGDGTISNAPSGYLKIWYRLAQNDYIRVKAGELETAEFTFSYTNSEGLTNIVRFTVELQDNMVTGIPSESIDEIKNNAPEVFYSKNRMVTGDDYNGMLPTLNNDALLMKAENRTFAGHSRYVDLKDPTGKSRPLTEFADDGYLYKEESTRTTFIADLGSRTTANFINEFVEKQLSLIGLAQFYYGKQDLLGTDSGNLFSIDAISAGAEYRWKLGYKDATTSNGSIIVANADGIFKPTRVGYAAGGFLRALRPGALAKVEHIDGTYTWAAVQDVRGDGLGVEVIEGEFTGFLVNGNGPVELNRPISEGKITRIIPPLSRVFDDMAKEDLTKYINDSETSTITLEFNNLIPSWTVKQNTNIIPTFDRKNPDYTIDEQNISGWLITLSRDSTRNGWIIVSRELNYVFGSEELIRFYNINFASAFNTDYKNIGKDYIDIMTLNNNNKMVSKQKYRVSGYYIYTDGYTDSSKVKVTPLDLDNDQLPDNPEHFLNLVMNDSFDLINYDEGAFSYEIPQNTISAANSVRVVSGTMNLAFKWEHHVPSDQTLNPSLTNIVDAYVLTKSYNKDFVAWKKKNSTSIFPPLPPTSEELRNGFTNLSSYKMLTDEVVFHSVKFKPLFGALADAELQAVFKVIKSRSSRLTDNEIKSKVLTAIDEYFAPGNFDFGEKFYFTELSTYIHTSLSSDLSSVVIVPVADSSKFGTLFQVQPNRNEIVTSVATVNNITVVSELTDKTIRIGQ